MGLTAGIVGLPNVGKSTLFNTITKQNILAANYPFATIDPNVGMVIVPDDRIDKLTEMYHPLRTIPTTYEFTDIAGLVKGASNGEGLGNKFLSHIREVDAIVEVVRCFNDKGIINVNDSVDPIRDIEIINIELIMSDLEIVTNRLNKIGKKAEMTKDKKELAEISALNKLKSKLEQNVPARKIDLTQDELFAISSFNLITLKPIIYICNVSEGDLINENNEYYREVIEYVNGEGPVIMISAKIESELAQLSEEDRKIFLNDLGINECGLDKLIRETYSLLGLATYFTVGTDEVKAWTFKKGMNAKSCAGLIHSDIERGFIKAEIMKYDDLETLKSAKEVQEAGKLNLEGKDYLMQDGDIVYFRFNV